MKLKTLLLTVLLSTSLVNTVYAENNYKMSCIGDLWDFGIGTSSNSQEHYWEDIVIKGDTLIAPKFGEYRKLGTQDGKRFWRMSTGDPEHNWARLNINNNEFTISVKEGGVTKQMDGKCSKKSNNWN